MIQEGVLPDLIRYVSVEEAALLDAAVARLEARTGVQVVPAVVGRSDAYPELPWHAFAVGAAFSAFGLVVADHLNPAWITTYTAVLHATIILGAGAVCLLAAAFLAPIARLLLRANRAGEEVRQYAESLFLRRALFATRGRTGLLVLVSLFERRIEILADSGFAGRVGEPEWQAVIARMAPRLRDGKPFEALRDALAAIEELLAAKGFRSAGGSNELPDGVIEEPGV
jgi:putative membrane protein